MLAIKTTFLTDAKSKTKEEFLAIYQHPFIVQFVSGSLSQTNPQVVFSTITAKNLESLIKQQSQLENQNKIITAIYPVAKTDKNPFASKIIIGRTSTQDIVIEDSSISKFHAYFETKDGTEFTICDRGSTNGTTLNALPLAPSIPKTLKDLDIVAFSSTSFTFYLPETAYSVFSSAKEQDK